MVWYSLYPKHNVLTTLKQDENTIVDVNLRVRGVRRRVESTWLLLAAVDLGSVQAVQGARETAAPEMAVGGVRGRVVQEHAVGGQRLVVEGVADALRERRQCEQQHGEHHCKPGENKNIVSRVLIALF